MLPKFAAYSFLQNWVGCRNYSPPVGIEPDPPTFEVNVLEVRTMRRNGGMIKSTVSTEKFLNGMDLFFNVETVRTVIESTFDKGQKNLYHPL